MAVREGEVTPRSAAKAIPTAHDTSTSAPPVVAPPNVIPLAERGRMPYLSSVMALLLCLIALLLGDARFGLALVSVTSCLFAMTVTIRRAGPYLPPSSVFFIASGVFIGGAGYYLLLVDTQVPIELIRDGAALAMITNACIAAYITTSGMRRGIVWPGPADRVRAKGLHRPPLMLLVWGLGVAILSQLSPFVSIVGPPAHAMGVGGILMMVTWAAARRADQQWFGDAFLMSMVFFLPILWTNNTFVHGGRLMIAGLLIAAFMAWNLFGPSKVQKALLIVCIPVFLILSGSDRASGRNDDRSVSTSGVIAEGEGLASVYAPLETWARMIGPLTEQQRDLLMPRYGATFVNTVYLPIPRTFWEDKPIGFGAELTEVFEPQMVRSAHSMASLMHGEWYANFGYLGLPLMVVVIGWLLVRMDRWHARLAWSTFERDHDWWSLAILVCLVSALGELYWVGSFTAFARGGMAAGAVAITRIVALRRHGPRTRWRPLPPAASSDGAGSAGRRAPVTGRSGAR